MEFEGDNNGHIYNQFLDIMKSFKAHEYVARSSLSVACLRSGAKCSI